MFPKCVEIFKFHENLRTATGIFMNKVKVKVPITGPVVAQNLGRGIALLFHDSGTRSGWVVSSTPRPTLPPGNTRYPLYRGLGGPQGRSGRAKNLSPPGFDPRTVQAVAQSLYRLVRKYIFRFLMKGPTFAVPTDTSCLRICRNRDTLRLQIRAEISAVLSY